MAKKAKTQALPGMEDRTIDELEEAGAEYAEIRDARMKLTTQEVELKGRVRRLMKKHKKTHYASAAVDIKLEPPDGDDKVSVTVKKPKKQADED